MLRANLAWAARAAIRPSQPPKVNVMLRDFFERRINPSCTQFQKGSFQKQSHKKQIAVLVTWLTQVMKMLLEALRTGPRGVSPDVLGEMASSLKLLVRRAEKALRTVNKAGESWPVDSLAMWAPDDGGPHIELQSEVMSPDTQQMTVVWQPYFDRKQCARGAARPHNPHTPTLASIDAPPTTNGNDGLHRYPRRIMV